MSKTLSILVVDDDVDNAMSLGELFEMEGHAVTIAHNGEDAIQAYTSTAFDLAFIDVMMPGRNGVESFLEIRKLRPNARVFMMTGYSVEQLLTQAMENGAMGVLSKPLDIRKLMRAVENASPSGIVVISDDDPNLGGELSEMMKAAGFACDVVRSTHQLKMHASDVVIIDTGETLMRGLEIHATLKKQGLVRPSIIITPSGKVDDGYEALRDVSVTGILNKPFDPLVLLNRLESLAA